MPITITVDDVQNDLTKLLSRVRGGSEEIIIEEGGQPVARLSPIACDGDGSVDGNGIPKTGKRVPGSHKGLFVVPDDFNDPLPDEIVDAWYQ